MGNAQTDSIQDEIQQQLENIAEQTGNEEYEFTDLN